MSCRASVVPRLLLPLRPRRLSGHTLRHPVLVASSAAAATFISARPYTSLLRKLGDSVTAKVTQLTEAVWLADEKLVTEPRRTIEPQHALSQNLAERLARQRAVKQRLVPTSVKVDRSRQYVEFTWPAEAAELMRGVSAGGQSPPPPTASPSFPDRSTATAPSAPSSSPSSSPSSPSVCAAVAETDNSEGTTTPPLLRTRALAEYLRAYTPSTDGALGSRDIVIYGRRGISIAQIVPMGNYALRFVFSDDHAGGIYSYEYLFYLTGPATKYGLMRAYIRDLRRRRKSRDPPKRAPSKRYAKGRDGGQTALESAKHGKE
ncbi:putative mitochondrial hypothetical protein [Leptomonas pyrrhocoris]|uniref:Gamma-butyrobetaine hydroxylase-like N-terminal domain-containing protein n=1 Tax=Leptomonas pyrrhocoris TaxID=157538 RepID=A0A0N0VEG7_LEPPY|nr:putative mitochondrial hypothetical protein [Leptomonas pyrrhocoris]XP_015656768.1 putative mitochondrial hypothetical protein [Leptomonas pyrrhocoris]KPA78328.1 putative mitochondrial hypothetical protein [Leptomonas pyrrhocoris]KPA78329.1 putative mitochondrial hypothetical protein [Leptomonas pyrrhocoris]|eukprot:XP_015656767.1 putative mitochondrial hypothetical protein [Leptomonas pyrrhocoris]